MELYEDDLKNSILHNKTTFKHLGELGQTCIVYEKTISGRVISDVLICSSKQGLIGVEIKTNHDNTKRLANQLKEYSKTCNYVYVLCHDDIADKVKEEIKQLKYSWVGIIQYTEFDNKPLWGLVKKAKLSPRVTTRATSSILWNSEKKLILDEINQRKGYYKQISRVFNLIDVKQAQRLTSSLYAYNFTKPEHRLQRYNFGDTYVHDRTTPKGVKFHGKRKRRK